MILYGIIEDRTTRRPSAIEGEPPINGKMRDLAKSLTSICAARIEPSVTIDAHALEIPLGEPNTGNRVLVVRVRAGLLTPYNLREIGIYLRGGKDGDRRASVREIQALFQRQASVAAPAISAWSRVRDQASAYFPQQVESQPPFVMVGLTPAFPIEPTSLDTHHDDSFALNCKATFYAQGGQMLREPDGVVYSWFGSDEVRDYPPYGCAYNDGSAGMRMSLSPANRWPEGRPEPLQVDLVYTWLRIRGMLLAVQQWPRQQCGYDGPLICRMELGNLAQTYAVVPGTLLRRFTHDLQPVLANRAPGWHVDMEWDQGASVDDLIEIALASLARQLQFGYFAQIKAGVRSLVLQQT